MQPPQVPLAICAGRIGITHTGNGLGDYFVAATLRRTRHQLSRPLPCNDQCASWVSDQYCSGPITILCSSCRIGRPLSRFGFSTFVPTQGLRGDRDGSLLLLHWLYASARKLLISEMSKSVQNSSVRASIHQCLVRFSHVMSIVTSAPPVARPIEPANPRSIHYRCSNGDKPTDLPL